MYVSSQFQVVDIHLSNQINQFLDNGADDKRMAPIISNQLLVFTVNINLIAPRLMICASGFSLMRSVLIDINIFDIFNNIYCYLQLRPVMCSQVPVVFPEEQHSLPCAAPIRWNPAPSSSSPAELSSSSSLSSSSESEKPCQRVSNADQKVFANQESFCDMLSIV